MVNTKRTAECLKQCTISWAVIVGTLDSERQSVRHVSACQSRCAPPQSAEGRAPGAVAPASMHCQLGQPVQAEHLWIA
eukprot:scaffold444_cov455-Pavlova_lutheri.AAC.1